MVSNHTRVLLQRECVVAIPSALQPGRDCRYEDRLTANRHHICNQNFCLWISIYRKESCRNWMGHMIDRSGEEFPSSTDIGAGCCRIWKLARAPLGGGCLNTPHKVFVNRLKTAARSAAVFGTPYHTSFPHMLCKFQT